MGTLSDVIKRTSAASQAAKSALGSGASKEEAARLAREAAGVKTGLLESAASDIRQAIENEANYKNLQNAMNADARAFGVGYFGNSDEENGGKIDEQKKKRSPWHERIDEALGEDEYGLGATIGGVVGDLTPLNFDPLSAANKLYGTVTHPIEAAKGTASELLDIGLAPLDIISPEWSWNGSQKDSANSRLNQGVANAPRTVVENGEYVADPNMIAMPSGEQLSDMTAEQLDEWLENTSEGLALSGAAGLNSLPGVGAAAKGMQKGMSPVLGSKFAQAVDNVLGSGWRSGTKEGADAAAAAGVKPAKGARIPEGQTNPNIYSGARRGGPSQKAAKVHSWGLPAEDIAARSTSIAEEAAKNNPLVKELMEKAGKTPMATERAEKATEEARNSVWDSLEKSVKKNKENAEKAKAAAPAAEEAAVNPYTRSAIGRAIRNIEKNAGRGKGGGIREYWGLSKSPEEIWEAKEALRTHGDPRIKLSDRIEKLKESGAKEDLEKAEKELSKLTEKYKDKEYKSEEITALEDAMLDAERAGGKAATNSDWERAFRALDRERWLPKAVLGGVGGLGSAGLAAVIAAENSIAPDNPLNQEAGNGLVKDSGGGVGESGSDIESPSGARPWRQYRSYRDDWLAKDSNGEYKNAAAKAWAEMYPQYADPEYGYATLFGSGDIDAFKYILDNYDPWADLYRNSGVDIDDPESIRDYVWGSGAINAIDYMKDPTSVSLNPDDALAAAAIAEYLALNNNFGFDPTFAKRYGLDSKDVAEMALAMQVLNNGWGNLNIDDVNDVINAAGDKGAFKIVNENDPAYESSKWRQKEKTYRGFDTDILTPYEEMGLADTDITAALMNSWNSTHPGGQKLAFV